MFGDVVDPLAADIDDASVAERFEMLLTRPQHRERTIYRLAARRCTVTCMMRLVLLWWISRLPSRAARMCRMMPA